MGHNDDLRLSKDQQLLLEGQSLQLSDPATFQLLHHP